MEGAIVDRRIRGGRSYRQRLAPIFLALLLAGCAAPRPVPPPSSAHIDAGPADPKVQDIPAPLRAGGFLPPPPKPKVKEPVYSVVVNEVPVKELLFALARDTKRNIDIHPGLQGLISLNAIDATLPAILDRIALQANLRYRQENDTWLVMPDAPYLKTYRVDYVNMSRDTTSTIAVSGQITPASRGGSGAQGAGSGASGNLSNTSVQTTSKNNFWELLRDNIRGILASTRALTQTADDRAARAEAARAAKEERLQQAGAVAGAGPNATDLFNAAFGGASPSLPGDPKDDIIINPVAGSVSVIATEKQHGLVQKYLDSVIASVARQVLIEATIVEVGLSDTYKAGVDWSRLAVSGGLNISQSLLAGSLATPPNFTVGYVNTNSPIGNISGTIRLLEQFGNTKVLSSPKLMALNNQTALLKVVDNLVYFSIDAQTTTPSTGPALTTFTTTAQTVPVGVVMSVTPQINENGAVTLTVRPTISRILGFKNDPNPSLGTGAARIINPVPEIQVREMESVLQVNSAQTVVLGGLMQDDVQRNRDGLPGLSTDPAVGNLFSFRDQQVKKTELVIFLRPTVIGNPSLESDELKLFRQFLPAAAKTGP